MMIYIPSSQPPSAWVVRATLLVRQTCTLPGPRRLFIQLHF